MQEKPIIVSQISRRSRLLNRLEVMVKGGGRASYGRAIASKFIDMKNVIQDLTQQIDYLCALAQIYQQESDTEAQMAALEARAALERLVHILHSPSDKPCPKFPAAA